jgi:hypothetical protein
VAEHEGAFLRERDGALEVLIHVQPRARADALAGVHGGALKVKLTAPPVEGAANRALIELFARLLDLPRARLAITSGEKSRDKTLRITGVSTASFLARLPASLRRDAGGTPVENRTGQTANPLQKSKF